MATKKGGKKGKAKAKTATAKAKSAEPKTRSYKPVSEMSERQKAYQARFAEAIAVIGCRIVQEHKKGFFLVQMPDGEWRVGQLSATGKSFSTEFKSESRAEALEFYQKNRPAKAEKSETPKKSGKKASKKGKGKASSGKKKSKKKAEKPSVDLDDDDIEDLID